jgi:hypothetical protein
VGISSGDANGDAVVDPADIFYVINYLFTAGPMPMALPVPVTGRTSTTVTGSIAGSVTLGKPVLRGETYVVPVIVTPARDSAMPQALALRVHFSAEVGGAVHRAGGAKDVVPVFEISRSSGPVLSYLVVFDQQRGLVSGTGDDRAIIVAEIEISSGGAAGLTIDVDPILTTLSDQGGTREATAANGKLRVAGAAIPDRPRAPQPQSPEVH